jgi:DbpA RNA binding domain
MNIYGKYLHQQDDLCFFTFVAMKREIAKEAMLKLNNGRVKGKSVRARVM